MTTARLDPARLPDANGHFGRFGGRFVPETLMSPLIELTHAYEASRRDRASVIGRHRGWCAGSPGACLPLATR